MELPPQFSQPQEQPPFPLRRFFTSRTTIAAKTRKTIRPTIKVERFIYLNSFPANDDARSCRLPCRTLHLRYLYYLAASTARTEEKVLSAVPFRNRSQSRTAAVTAAATVPRPKLPPRRPRRLRRKKRRRRSPPGRPPRRPLRKQSLRQRSEFRLDLFRTG